MQSMSRTKTATTVSTPVQKSSSKAPRKPKSSLQAHMQVSISGNPANSKNHLADRPSTQQSKTMQTRPTSSVKRPASRQTPSASLMPKTHKASRKELKKSASKVSVSSHHNQSTASLSKSRATMSRGDIHELRSDLQSELKNHDIDDSINQSSFIASNLSQSITNCSIPAGRMATLSYAERNYRNSLNTESSVVSPKLSG